jgi:hypothetical protein
MGGNAYEYQPYSRNDLKIKGTRIAIFKAVTSGAPLLRSGCDPELPLTSPIPRPTFANHQASEQIDTINV